MSGEQSFFVKNTAASTLRSTHDCMVGTNRRCSLNFSLPRLHSTFVLANKKCGPLDASYTPRSVDTNRKAGLLGKLIGTAHDTRQASMFGMERRRMRV